MLLVVGGGAGSHAHYSADVTAQVVGRRTGVRGLAELRSAWMSRSSIPSTVQGMHLPSWPVMCQCRHQRDALQALARAFSKSRDGHVTSTYGGVESRSWLSHFFLHGVPHKSAGVAVDTHRQEVGLHQLAGKQPLCFDAVLVTLSTRRRPARDLAAASQAASCSGMASSEVRKRIIYAGGEGRGWPSKLRLKICGRTCV